MRIAIAQINATLGNFSENAKKIIEFTKKAQARHCDLIIFPESSLFGYHPFDLLEREDLVDAQLKELKYIEKNIPTNLAVVVGVITKNNKSGRPYHNSAAVIIKGKKLQFFHKQLLPTGDVFDEARFIEPGETRKNFFKYKGKKFLVTVCEDIWAWDNRLYVENPLLKIKNEKPDIVLNLSASPFYPQKLKLREKLVVRTAKHFSAPTIYCNMVGAQDEIIFDGRSFGVDKKGRKIFQSLAFEEDFNIYDTRKGEGGLHALSSDTTELTQQAIKLGLSDFCKKTGLKKIHLGISGGIDSAVVACLATDAVGPGNVKLISMPTKFNAPESEDLSIKLAKNLGVEIISIQINEIYEVIKKIIDEKFYIEKFSLVHENLQARIRGLLLMAFANQNNSLLLSTSNKSELAAGYATLYGDMCGGISPIGDLTKGEVYALAKYYNQHSEIIPQAIINRAPSAELRPNQKDQDTLPEYSLLDSAVLKLVEKGKPAKGQVEQWLLSALFKSEFKRWQSPPILKVRPHSFGRGRRWPVANQADKLKQS